LLAGKKQIMAITAKATRILLAAGILLCLLQIWLPFCYPNCDGPCHLNNAAITGELWWGQKGSIYERFYMFNYGPNPNWLTNLLLLALEGLFTNIVAEKVLLSGFVLLMIGGYMRLLTLLKNGAQLWPLVIFIFIFLNPLAQGFYNFSFSIACYFWLTASWLSYLDHRTWKHIVLFFLMLTVTWFCHPVSFIFGGFTAGALALSYLFSASIGVKVREWGGVFCVLVISILPFVFLFLGFADRFGGMEQVVTTFSPDRLKDLAFFKYAINYSHKEEDVLIAVGLLFVALFLLLLAWRVRAGRQVNKHDGLLLTLLFALWVFLYMPDALLHAGYLVMRAGIYVWLLISICLVYIPAPQKLLNSVAAMVFVFFVVLFFIRMPVSFKAADAIEDYLSAEKYIKPGSVVLPLCYDTWGVGRDGKTIASRNNIFCHMAQYITVPGVLVLDNYEANTGYFPLLWKPRMDPFMHLGRIHYRPPSGDIGSYRKESGVVVDNVLMMNFHPSFRQDGTAGPLVAEIERDYHIVYTSATGRTILFERNR
jgi:hypothetical protein